ncbi:MAG: DUF4363 family protein [Clostridia bacterium]|nr:DUF4363 family protein [Clostridia bacterium]
MKRFILALILTLTVTFFSFYSVIFLEKTAFEMTNILKEVKESVQEGDWQSAQLKLKNFTQEWEKKHFWWELLVNHNEVDMVSNGLAYLQSYLETRNLAEALAEINALFNHLEHIPEGERLTIRNLL